MKNRMVLRIIIGIGLVFLLAIFIGVFGLLLLQIGKILNVPASLLQLPFVFIGFIAFIPLMVIASYMHQSRYLSVIKYLKLQIHMIN